jgi:hypothetical protein
MKTTLLLPPIPDLTNWQPDPGSFRDIFETARGQAIFKLMVQHDSLLRLQTGGFYGCVAVESLSRTLLATFGEDLRPPRIKKFIGFMGRKIMQKLGFRIDSRNIKIRDKVLFVSRGASYTYVGEIADDDDQDTDAVTEE